MNRGLDMQRARGRHRRVESLGVSDCQHGAGRDAAAAIIASASASDRGDRLLDQHGDARARGTAGRPARCDSVGTAIVTASTAPSSAAASVDQGALHGAADDLRARGLG